MRGKASYGKILPVKCCQLICLGLAIGLSAVGIAEKAKEIQHLLKEDFVTDFDASGSVGKRYRRQDEVGTPFCVTVDYDTIHEKKDDGSDNPDFGSVTVRFRDSMQQERVKIDDLVPFIQKKIREYKPVEKK